MLTAAPSAPATRRPALARAVSWLLGSLLLAAALLKLSGASVSPYAQYGTLMDPGVQFLAAEWEIVLGAWLLSGRSRSAAWAAAVATFVAFAGVSLYLGLAGQASCGCFGAVRASPWLAFGVDALALLLLVAARPALGELRGSRFRWRAVAGPALGTLSVWGLCIGLAVGMFGSVDAALAALRGGGVSVRPAVADIGRGLPGQTLETTVEVTNWTAASVRLIGGTSDCSCVATSDLPLTLGPHETKQLRVRVSLVREPGLFNRKAVFWTDDREHPVLLLRLVGRIDPTTPDPSAPAER